jgi:glycosyltransferase involved in cell wall biosynthesis
MIIISPSGNLYGSESVLVDYLGNTQNKDIFLFLPSGSKLYSKIRFRFPGIKIGAFSNTYVLYAKLILILIFRTERIVYCNEGGHIRYLNILANYFGYVRFFNHIRIKEDTKKSRLGFNKPKNLTHFVVSDYLGNLIGPLKYIRIYDPYPFKKKGEWKVKFGYPIRIGIVGRVTPTKGLDIILEVIKFLNDKSKNDYEFHFYGDVEVDKIEVVEFIKIIKEFKSVQCSFHGFVEDKETIYSQIDLLFHANQQEALGRVILEALDYSVPVIGVNKGGIYELFKLIGLESFCLDLDKDTYPSSFVKLLSQNRNENKLIPYKKAVQKAYDIFNEMNYANKLDTILSNTN